MYAIVMFLKIRKDVPISSFSFLQTQVSHLRFNLQYELQLLLVDCLAADNPLYRAAPGWWVANATDIGSDCLILSGIMVQASLR